MTPRRLLGAALLLLVPTSACKTTEPTPDAQASAKPAPTQGAQPLPFPAGLDEAAMNLEVSPCEDFYEYACGGWVAKTEIPADRPRWSRGFLEIQQRNETLLREIAEGLTKDPSQGVDPAVGQLVGDYYASCMDEAALEKTLPALQQELSQFSNLKDAAAVSTALAQLHRQYLPGLFTFSYTPDYRDVTQVIGEMDQGGLGLPDRDYYLKDDAKTQSIRDAYVKYATAVFTALGDDAAKAAASAKKVLELETALAKASLSRVDRRDAEKLYHRLERDGLRKQAPTVRWDLYFARMGTPNVTALNVTHPPFFAEVDRLVKTTKPDVWKAYLSFSFVRGTTDALPKAIRDAAFAFEQTLTGAPQELPRWKKCIAATDEAVGHALAQPFIAKTFGADGKQITTEMVKEIEAAFERNLATLEWMDGETKGRALEKLHTFINKIGYPDQWRDYTNLTVSRASFLKNVLGAGAFEKARVLAKIGKPLDKGEWFMTPPTVNAYYNAQTNEIVFPAGILQPPFFNREATYPVNFGAMGMVVGHEITHGFDDEGRKFDAQGNLKTWWTAASDKAFNERAACVERQYSNETAIDELKVNGKLTLGENTADLGGIKLAYMAMQAYAKKQPPLAEARFTPEQQFFLGYAQSWCSKYRPEFARVRALTDPHSPPNLRVNVPLRNTPQFAAAFQCEEGQKMALPKAERCSVW